MVSWEENLGNPNGLSSLTFYHPIILNILRIVLPQMRRWCTISEQIASNYTWPWKLNLSFSFKATRLLLVTQRKALVISAKSIVILQVFPFNLRNQPFSIALTSSTWNQYSLKLLRLIRIIGRSCTLDLLHFALLVIAFFAF